MAFLAAATAGFVLVIASASAGVVTAQSPRSTAPPTISGTARVGETLTAAQGSWSGDTPITFRYAWLSCDSSGGHCFTVATAASWTYLLLPGDQGRRFRVVVTATNATGAAQATSDPSPSVSGPGGAPPASAPAGKAACKHGGWKRFTNPTFRNQGQCVSYAVHHARKDGGRNVHGNDHRNDHGNEQGDHDDHDD